MNGYAARVVALALALTGLSCGAPVQSSQFGAVQECGIVQTPLITEASGIVASRKNAGVIWVHNDSGDAPRLFALDTKANLLGVCTVVGAQARDWEDIAVGPGPDPNVQYLYIGDIGDNNARRRSVQVYRILEPDLDPTQPFGEIRSSPSDVIELTYPDGARDAETLLVDPLTRDIYVITKRELFSRVYRAAWPQSTIAPTPLERVALLPWPFATGGDVSTDGRQVIVRGLYNASLWVRPEGEPLWRAFQGRQIGLPLASEPQGEAITFDSTGRGYFTLSEKAKARLYYFERIAKEGPETLSVVPPKP
jgi:hypothetical protein